MENIQNILIILQIIIAVVLIAIVLLQKNDGDSLSGIGGNAGGLNSVMSSKSSANALTKTTFILIAIFMINCLALASIAKHKSANLQKELEAISNQKTSTESNNSPENQPVNGNTQPSSENKPSSNKIPNL